MRSVSAGLFTAIAMIAMIVAVPGVWLNERVVSPDGFVSSASEAAKQSEVQDYFAEKIAASVEEETGSQFAATAVAPAARNYTRSPGFVEDFAEVARQQHDWLFTTPDAETDLHLLELDITPMINRVIRSAPLPVPVDIDGPVIVTVDQGRVTAGSFEDSGTLIRIVAWAAVIAAVVGSLLALVLANRRSTVLAWLGVGGVIAGAVGWVLAMVAKDYIGDRLADTDDSSRTAIEVVVGGIVDNLSTISEFVALGGVIILIAGVAGRVVVGRR